MRTVGQTAGRHTITTIPGLLIWLFVLATGPTALADDGEAGPDDQPEFRHGLENTRFVGTWTYEWDRAPVEGVFNFKHGKFISQGCLEWGYSPAPYYVRRDDDGIHFFARLRNPEHGTMEFSGVFDGERLRADVHWEKERWYWTLEQRYQFTGTPVDRRQ